ncbi:MAG TPA: TetR/AcrR family transcriptional regulator [Bryobacteraceae bacterium]|nr:TetR/AcrR family transcriptional regulator [Bryobacteraceae bacterium]HWC00090.1 TetR/AcrR family transcriptional regulator [Bryobacteraceae bacterium]
MALAGKSKHDIVSEFRCAEILAAARKVFATKGFRDATVDDIAAEAGIAKGTVYLYYPSKKEMYLAALKQGLEELRQRTGAAMHAAAGAEAKLRAFVRTRMEYAEANRDFFRIYHSEFGNLNNDSEFQQLYLQQAKTLESVLHTAAKKGEIRRIRADFSAFLIYDMVKSVMIQRLLGRSTARLDDDIETLAELIWKGLAV